ncbi:MAG: hypothetical protein K2J82_02500 [Muribaculaceae bacterium]|nr:hypothetical protein [Muribaculaceae bacterium]MDE6753461.1 hypothetical protein [Muribaculaceae bacterium]
MNFAEIKKLVVEEYDRRDLKSDVRYKALNDFDEFLKKKDLIEMWNDVSKFPDSKEIMKELYRRYLDKAVLSGAESSMINEVYNQIKAQGIELTDYTK